MPILPVYISELDLADLDQFAKDLGRTVDDLAEAALSDAICSAKRPPQDPCQPRLDL